MEDSNWINPIYQELFIKNSIYYLSSRCVFTQISGSYANFGVRWVDEDEVTSSTLMGSMNGTALSTTGAFRPVVTLDASVQLSAEPDGEFTL